MEKSTKSILKGFVTFIVGAAAVGTIIWLFTVIVANPVIFLAAAAGLLFILFSIAVGAGIMEVMSGMKNPNAKPSHPVGRPTRGD